MCILSGFLCLCPVIVKKWDECYVSSLLKLEYLQLVLTFADFVKHIYNPLRFNVRYRTQAGKNLEPYPPLYIQISNPFMTTDTAGRLRFFPSHARD